MKAILTILFLALSSGSLLADITKEELRRLLDAHVSDAAIVSYIRKHGPVQPLSIEDITELKKAGASDEVLRTLVEASRPSDAVTRPSESPEPYDDPGPPSTGGYYYYYYPYYAPFTLYPSFIYSYRPYRCRYYYPSYRSPTVPRVWVRPPVVRPGGVHPYRPSTTPPPPRPNNNQPRGGSGSHGPYR